MSKREKLAWIVAAVAITLIWLACAALINNEHESPRSDFSDFRK
jgi:hypothetical protein